MGGGATVTTLHPAVGIALLVSIVLIFALPRRAVIIPVLLSIFLIPMGQVIVWGGMHFPVSRIILIAACLRASVMFLESKSESLAGGFNSVDKAFIVWGCCYAVFFVLQWNEMQAVINRAGFVVDGFGGYFLLRLLIRDDKAVNRTLAVFAVIAAVVAAEMVYEQFTLRNLFGMLGGTHSIPELRDGRIRSCGVFQHAILAGSFGATMLPLFLGLLSRKAWVTAIVGAIGATVIVVTSSSSTPLLAYAAVLIGFLFWFLRTRMRLIRWAILIVLIALQLSMKADVWWLISHVDLVGGSSYHRANLVDTFIKHFSDWWLIGTKDYDQWGWDMWDVSNQFVAMGLNAGLLGLVAFLIMISKAFGKLGIARRRLEKNRGNAWFMWCLGIALFGHVVAFFGTGYWDQTQIAWFALFAMISATTAGALNLPTKTLKPVARFRWPGWGTNTSINDLNRVSQPSCAQTDF